MRAFLTQSLSEKVRQRILYVWQDKRFHLLLRAFCTVGLIAWCLDRFWSNDILTSLVRADLRFLLFSFAVSLSTQLIWGVRWHFVLAELHYRIAPLRLALVNLMSQGAALISPGTVGADIVRAHCNQKDGVPLKQAFVSIFIDRFFGFAGLFVLAIGASLWLSSNAMPFWQLVFILVGGYGLLYIALHLPETVKQQIEQRLQSWSMKHHLDDIWRAFVAFKRSLKHPLFLSRQVALSILIQALHATTAMLIALAFDISIAWVTCLMVIPLVSIVSSLPVSINGLGVRETALVLLLTELGYASEDGLLIALVMTAELYLVSAIGAAVAISRGIELREKSAQH